METRWRWAALTGLSLDQLVVWGVLYYAYTVLAGPMAEDLGISPRVVAGAFSLALLVAALLARLVGRALDRLGARRVMCLGALLGAVSFAVLPAVQGPVGLFAVFAVLGGAQALSLYDPAFRALVEWYPQASQRSRAFMILTTVGAFASAVFVPLTAFLVASMGWRAAVAMLAVVLAVVTVPTRLALPAPPRGNAAGAGDARVAFEWRGANRAWSQVGAAFALQSFAATGTTVCLVWHLVERGYPLGAAAAVAGLIGAAQVPGRLVLAWLQAVWPTSRRLPAQLALQAVALLAIAFGSPLLVLAGVCVFGATAGMMTLERAAVALEWFGPENFGRSNGQIASMVAFARAAAPLAVAGLHGRVSYAAILCLFALGILVSDAVVLEAFRRRAGVAGGQRIGQRLRRTERACQPTVSGS